MNSTTSISYAILACNEAVALTTLLNKISQSVQRRRETNVTKMIFDEVVIVLDESTYTEEVENAIKSAKLWTGNAKLTIRYYFHPLNQNFAKQKNFLNSKCNGNWIFNIDADEYPSDSLLDNIHKIIDINPQIDAYWLPRVNTVDGLQQTDIDKWRWNVNEKGWVNWPDWQLRLYRNTPSIKWTKPVHEQLVGYEYFAKFPDDPAYALYHPKKIDRQRKQNEFYEKIVQ